MIKISSSHWTFPPFPEIFVYLFLVGVYILQYLFLFVNSFLKIYLYFFNFRYFSHSRQCTARIRQIILEDPLKGAGP